MVPTYYLVVPRLLLSGLAVTTILLVQREKKVSAPKFSWAEKNSQKLQRSAEERTTVWVFVIFILLRGTKNRVVAVL
jgi:hypothetical protein